MGHLFSRAIKRLTQCGAQAASLSRLQQQQQQSREQEQELGREQEQRQASSPPDSQVESIPVGQSIDLAEYAAFEQAQGPMDAEQATIGDTEADTETEQAEEAAIKIQALIRGHLTRKALKADHQQQQQSAVHPSHELGHRQFDEQALLANPPSAVFSPSSPLKSIRADQELDDELRAGAGSQRLASIAEVHNEAQSGASQQAQNEPQQQQQHQRPVAASKLEMPARSDSACRSGSPASPAMSEANASIDLGACPETPACQSASASIDILDHNVRPADQLASILHPNNAGCSTDGGARSETEKVASWLPAVESSAIPVVDEDLDDAQDELELELGDPTLGAPRGAASASADHGRRQVQLGRHGQIETPDSLLSSPIAAANDSIGGADFAEETAAIKIQSAFRGYRTRKNSPYRHRSPTDLASGSSTGQSRQVELQQNGHSVEPRADLLDADLDDDAANIDDGELGQKDGLPIGDDLDNDMDDDDDDDDLDEPTVCSMPRSSRPSEPVAGTDDDSLALDCSTGAALISAGGEVSSIGIGLSEANTEPSCLAQTGEAALTSADDAGQQAPSDHHRQQQQQVDRQPSLELTDSSLTGAVLTLSEDLPGEIDSDNLERRDPSGSASEGQPLAGSGNSSPLGNDGSSNGNESSNEGDQEDDDDGDDENDRAKGDNGNQKQQQQQQQQKAGKNRKRNRRKGGNKK